jgi:putative transposase
LLPFLPLNLSTKPGEVHNNPKGNADTERMIRTMKEELFWLREWESERGLSLELDKWIDYYNRSYLHSAIG